MSSTGGNEEQSASTQSTSATTTNQDVAAQSSGIAIGAGASYVNDFSPEVAQAVSNVVTGAFNFSGKAIDALGLTSSQSVAGSNAAVASANQIANQATNNAQLGQSSLLTNPAVIFGAIAVIGIIAFLIIRKK